MNPIVEYINAHERFFDPRKGGVQPDAKLNDRQIELIEWLEQGRRRGGKYLVLQARDTGVSTVLVGWGTYHDKHLPWMSRTSAQTPHKLAAQYPGATLRESKFTHSPIAIIDWCEHALPGRIDAHPEADCLIMTGGLRAMMMGEKFDGVFVMNTTKERRDDPMWDEEHLFQTEVK